MIFFQFEIIINVLVSSFEYLCYRSMAIIKMINILILTMRGTSLDVII